MKPVIKLSCLLIMRILYGCDKNFESVNEYHIGTTYRINPALSFRINSLNDSRCPESARCFWAGNVVLFCHLDYKNYAVDTSLYLEANKNNFYRLGGYKFTVLDVEPLTQGSTTSDSIEIKMSIASE